jgi:general secretion pathway protein A
MDLLAYWNLRERPFEATWDIRFFFPSRSHDEALNRLCFLVGEQSMNMGMLTGEIGCGKTLTRSVFTRRLDPLRFYVVTQENSSFAFKELLVSVLRIIEGEALIDTKMSKFNLCERLRKTAVRLQAENRHLVMIFDEAQEMTPAALNELKLLTNLNGGGINFLTIILLGQPELRLKVARLPAINQRISLRFHLGPMNVAETAGYLQHRLKAAGHPTGDLFADQAVERIYQAAQGIPRQVNRIAKLALEFAWLRELPQVSFDAVETVVRDLERHQNLMVV